MIGLCKNQPAASAILLCLFTFFESEHTKHPSTLVCAVSMSFNPPLNLQQSYTDLPLHDAYNNEDDDDEPTIVSMSPESKASILETHNSNSNIFMNIINNNKKKNAHKICTFVEEQEYTDSNKSSSSSKNAEETEADDDDSDSDDSSDADGDIPVFELLMRLNGVTEEIEFKNNGYQKMGKVCNTLQGSLIDAVKVNKQNDEKSPNEQVMIKKIDKELNREGVSFADDEDYHFCVNDNIEKEQKILKYLTVDYKHPTDSYIVRYIDFFESDSAYYLVTESVFNQMNLTEFIQISHKLIKDGKLRKKEYNKIVKYIAWQILTILHWLHHDMHCTCVCTYSFLYPTYIIHTNTKKQTFCTKQVVT